MSQSARDGVEVGMLLPYQQIRTSAFYQRPAYGTMGLHTSLNLRVWIIARI